jgi:hypothetical protein
MAPEVIRPQTGDKRFPSVGTQMTAGLQKVLMPWPRFANGLMTRQIERCASAHVLFTPP